MAELAPPYLASTLINLPPRAQTRPPASSGSFAIDTSSLDGGYRYGEITSIAGPTGTGKTLLGYHAIASHLLLEDESREPPENRRAGGEVAFIDTTGGFSVMRLRDVLIFRLKARRQRRGDYEDGQVRQAGEDVAEEATRMLGRVRIMRVFDLVGVIEALGEIGEKTIEDKGNKRKREVEDSEDEEDDGGDNETQMQPGEADEGQTDDGRCSIGMIVIDTIANVASSVVSQNAIQGQALLARCMRSLQHLVTRHLICTLLINSVVGLGPSSDAQHRRSTDNKVSIFASSLGKPALGKTFACWVDTSVFLSMIPKTQDDATMAYGDSGQGRTWSKAIVMEVLKDRNGAREGRWTAFETADLVKLVRCFT